LGGKLGRRGVVPAVRPGRLFFISDSTSQRRYLVDTGSAFSIMPWQSSTPPSGPSLSGADGRRIPCWGEKAFTVTIGGIPRQWQFLLAAVSFPILGVDFLSHHALVVDVANLRLSSPPSVVGPGAAVQGSTEVKAPSGSSVTPATARPPPFSVVGTITPGRSYADAVRAAPAVSPPTQAGVLSSPGISSAATPPTAGTPLSTGEWLAATKLRYPQVFFQDAATSSLVPPHGVRHVIQTVGQPATAKFRRLDPTRLAAAKREFQSMLDEGVIRRSSSQWSSPLHMVQKPDGSWRPCGDYRQLNLQTVEDKYPLPNMADLAARLDGCKLFSKLDLRKRYLQVPVATEDIAKTAIITPFGLFEFTRMPFGLRNAGMTFQRLMDSLLGNLPFAFVYLDDILVASPDPSSHRRHLEAVFAILQSNGLVVNADKCLFGLPEVDFLGHRLTAKGISPLPSRVQAIANFPQPPTVKHLQAFLGLFNFYRRFIPAAAKIVQPLTRALRGGPKGSTPLVWLAAMRDTFSAARQALSSLAVLVHPAPGAELSLVTDASATHVGAAIQQRRPGQAWRPLGFFSAQLDKAQVGYSAFDRELLAVVAAIRHFRYMLEGRCFVVFTDHKPLVGALHRRSDPISARQQRHLSFIAEFAPVIRHITGESNIVADTLSRPASYGPGAAAKGSIGIKAPSRSPVPSATAGPPLPRPPIGCGLPPAGSIVAPIGCPGEADARSTGIKAPPGSPVPAATASLRHPSPPVDLAALAAAQPACPDCQRASSSSSLRVYEVSMNGIPILVDTSSGVFRPLVPDKFRRPIFDAIHGLAHPGIRASKRLISSRFVWPGLASQVAAWCRDCQPCQRAKSSSSPASPPLPIANPTQRFSHLHVDLVGPLPASAGGHTHLLTVLDRSTRWA
jgi:hypothetical protein